MSTDVLRVFLAEDSSGDVYLVGEALKRAGLAYELHLAQDGEQAIEMLRRFGADLPYPHVALLDLNLPRHDGSELLQQIRNHPEYGQIPIVVLTSSEAPADHRLAMDYEAVFFHKPLDMDEYFAIGETVKELCRVRGKQSSASGE